MCLLHVIAAIHLTQDGAFLGLSDSLPYVRKAYRRKKVYQVIEPGNVFDELTPFYKIHVVECQSNDNLLEQVY
jgi:hypothetical protein